MEVPRNFSLVKCTSEQDFFTISRANEDKFLFMGQIPNMPGHCVVMGLKTNKIYSGVHTERFIELTEEET